MRDSEKKKWATPGLRSFKDAAEVWEHYKSKGTPEERARLKILLNIMRGRTSEADDERPRRRA